MNLFAIMICTSPDRKHLLKRLLDEFDRLSFEDEYLIILNNTKTEKQGGPTTGAKRNTLVDAAIQAGATHGAFFDDDDIPGPTYLQRNQEATNGDYDTAELWGQYYEHSKQMNPFHHSLAHKKWWQDNKFYYRCPNHLNCMKLEKVKDIKFLDRTFGEDGNWSEDIQKAGVLKTEYPVKEITYYYFHGKRNYSLEPSMAKKRGTKL
ncbi:MAG TPA: hypothetical protein VGK39_03065 [Cyclobacteriaceae bacterium]